jgi:hypothetical protein
MATESISISCDECALQHSDACEECVVSILLGPEEPAAVIVDVMEARAMRMLQGVGLVPELRFRRRVS